MENEKITTIVNEYRNLDYYLRKGYFPYNLSRNQINFEFGFFLGIDECHPIYLAGNINNQSLKKTHIASQKYIEESIDILRKCGGIYEEPDYPNRVQFDPNHKNLYAIESELGKPPLACKPIYIMTVEKEGVEEVVYIGKTNSSSNRFNNGHAAITKLHGPEYGGKKRIYLATVMFLSEDEYVPLEFLEDFNEMDALLIAIEGTLINHFKPDLNTHNRKETIHSVNSQVHIQNFVGSILNDSFIYLN
ncbi:hypothetical protein ACQUEF_03565 [Vagococcus fluvialis]|uniref:hypothetical protein n=1 Tax=Vagococcus fluvialis TaxID=2738 RepID=UPI003D11CFF4